METLCGLLPSDWRPYSGFRTFEEQAKLYAQGRSAPGKIVTMTHPGYSMHNYGLACDFACFTKGKDPWEADWTSFKNAVELVGGLRWGGDFQSFKDKPHVELKIDHDIHALVKTFNEGGLKAVWELLEG